MLGRYIQEQCLSNLDIYYMSVIAYQVEEIKKGKLYVAMHTEAEWREKWCGVSYKVCSVEERGVSVVNSLTWEYSAVMC